MYVGVFFLSLIFLLFCYSLGPKVAAREGATLLLAGGGLLARPTLPVIVFFHGLGAMHTYYSTATFNRLIFNYKTLKYMNLI